MSSYIKSCLGSGQQLLLAGLLSFAGISALHAQSSSDLAEARANLIGHGERTWIKERVVVSMGSSESCTAGETYTFHANNSVDVRTCSNHVLVKRTVPWMLVVKPPLDIELRFDGKSFQLSFGGTSHAPQMRWRRPGQMKPDPTTDIYLGLSKD